MISKPVKEVTLDDLKGFYSMGDDHLQRCKHCGAITGELRRVTFKEARKVGYAAGWRERSYAMRGLISCDANKRQPYGDQRWNLEWQKGYDKGYAECF